MVPGAGACGRARAARCRPVPARSGRRARPPRHPRCRPDQPAGARPPRREQRPRFRSGVRRGRGAGTAGPAPAQPHRAHTRRTPPDGARAPAHPAVGPRDPGTAGTGPDRPHRRGRAVRRLAHRRPDSGLVAALRANASALARTAGEALFRPAPHGVLLAAGTSLDDSGQHAAAAEYYRDLADRCRTHLGPEHPDTIVARRRHARSRGAAGDVTGALTELGELLADQRRTQGGDHPDVLLTRQALAHLRGEAGDPAGRWPYWRNCSPTGGAYRDPRTPTPATPGTGSPSGVGGRATRPEPWPSWKRCCRCAGAWRARTTGARWTRARPSPSSGGRRATARVP
ncbi:hypothetical protein DN402_07735 [Streptomyces sp. SW4]|nr:hypothetical protein DN402_07735 [Streptomyces sp. SW4]